MDDFYLFLSCAHTHVQIHVHRSKALNPVSLTQSLLFKTWTSLMSTEYSIITTPPASILCSYNISLYTVYIAHMYL